MLEIMIEAAVGVVFKMFSYYTLFTNKFLFVVHKESEEL